MGKGPGRVKITHGLPMSHTSTFAQVYRDRYGITGDRYGVTECHPRCDPCHTLNMSRREVEGDDDLNGPKRHQNASFGP